MKLSNILFLCLCCFFFACQSNDRNEMQHLTDTVVIGLTSDFDTLLELATANSDALHVIEEMLFLTLNELDEKLNFQPRLAKSWRQSKDGKMLEFSLRDDVSWTDGQPTTAEDVLFTFQLATNPETGYAASGRFSQVDSAVVVDAYTIRFFFESAYPDAQYDVQIPILPQHLLQNVPPAEIRQAAFNRQPVGNGPYLLKEWLANDRVVFEANENYFAGKPNIRRIVFRIIPDESVLLTNLLTGEVDLLPYVAPQKISEIEQNAQYRVISYPDRGYSFLAFNLKRPLLQNVRVREAAAKAINRNDLIQVLLNGRGQPISGPVMPYFHAHDSTLDSDVHNPQESKEILKSAGWRDTDGDGFLEKNGAVLEFSMKTNADNKLRSDALVMMQSDFQKVGIRAKVELVEWNKLVEDVLQRRDFDTVLLSWKTGYTVNPSQIWHSDAIEKGFNLGAYQNPRVDSLLVAARQEMDSAKALLLWRQFNRIVAKAYPYIFLYMQENPAVLNQRLRNVKMDVRGYLPNVENWSLDHSIESFSNK